MRRPRTSHFGGLCSRYFRDGTIRVLGKHTCVKCLWVSFFSRFAMVEDDTGGGTRSFNICGGAGASLSYFLHWIMSNLEMILPTSLINASYQCSKLVANIVHCPMLWIASGVWWGVLDRKRLSLPCFLIVSLPFSPRGQGVMVQFAFFFPFGIADHRSIGILQLLIYFLGWQGHAWLTVVT